MSSYVSTPIVLLIGAGLVSAMVAAFAVTYSSTSIGGATISSMMSTVSTQGNATLPYLLAMVSFCVISAMALRRRK